ncbi:MAG TPA: hypothetical protein VF424_14515 [Vicinamibacterales bacterium]
MPIATSPTDCRRIQENARHVGAERHSQPDLRRSLIDRVRDDAVHAHHREGKCQPGEHGKKKRLEVPLGEPQREGLVERPDVRDRLVGIDGPDRGVDDRPESARLTFGAHGKLGEWQRVHLCLGRR